MADFRQTIHNRLHKRFGVAAVYIPDHGVSYPVTIKLRVGVAVYGDGMEFIGDEDQVVFLLTDIVQAKKKDLFIVRVKGKDQEYQLIKALQNDGVRAIWSVRHVD
jgi:hypothetical protein